MKIKKPLPWIISGVLAVVLISGGILLYEGNHPVSASSSYITSVVRS